MSLFFGELAYLIDEVQSLPEVLQPKVVAQVVLLDNLPFGYLSPERVELLSLEGRNTTPARYARLARQFGHSVPPVKMNVLRTATNRRSLRTSLVGSNGYNTILTR